MSGPGTELQNLLAELGIRNIDSFDYRVTQSPGLRKHFLEFQKQATQQYHDWLHAEARRYAQARYPGQSITFSGNLLIQQLRNGASSWLFPYFDFLLSEAHGDRNSMVPLLRELSGWMSKLPLAGGKQRARFTGVR